MNPIHALRCPSRCRPAAQRGVVLLFALIALVVIMVASVALVRSFNTSLFTAGNLAFKRDLVNQGERVVPVVFDAMTIGPLAAPAARAVNVPANNYSAVMLPTNNQGIPLQLLVPDAEFVAGVVTNDVPIAAQQVKIRYIVDRLCDGVGMDATLGEEHCNFATPENPAGDDAGNKQSPLDTGPSGEASAVPRQVVYRLSVRVDGPRKTQAFFQTTFTL